MNHQLNRLTGGTDITRSRHLTVSINMSAVSHRSITANRAFRGMAGLAVLYPSVLDYIGQAVKDSPVYLLGDFRGYSVNLCR